MVVVAKSILIVLVFLMERDFPTILFFSSGSNHHTHTTYEQQTSKWRLLLNEMSLLQDVSQKFCLEKIFTFFATDENLSSVNDYIAPTANCITCVKIYSVKYFFNARVGLLDEILTTKLIQLMIIIKFGGWALNCILSWHRIIFCRF